ncbi:PIN domain-containing protein [Amphiplicatus metriothermophilus]|uniref:PIN domain-containing protein n=1 Tax=Amphiplicatus metriothermophilus TaxID=1519374 RepID=UPI000B78F026|nr:PIN domain-containing protein [Amphiplicatus metriothermophilus]MBB5519166.1 hypothetical protein [Amphiplicatus metriothermophilus]
MTYVFDSSSFFELNSIYPSVFPGFWRKFDDAARTGLITSTREVRAEVKRGADDFVLRWSRTNKEIFTTPDGEETAFVAEILAIPHFQQIINRKAQQRGTPVADPFVIACAKVKNGIVVTQERLKPNAAKIPNVCQHFNIPCTNLEGFLTSQKWSF